MKNINQLHIDELKSIIFNKMAPLIDNDFILLDVPNHRNIGDSLIWKGELEFFNSINHRLQNQYNRYTFVDSAINSEGLIILLHGGGNFGDIYSSSQHFRKKIISRFKKNKIIMFPQSVHYNNMDNMVEDFKVFNNHPLLYLCVRDLESYDLLEKFFPKERLLLVPDMAFFINFNDKASTRSQKTLVLARTDAEAIKFDFSEIVCERDYDIKDWPTYANDNKMKNLLTNYIEALDGKVCDILKNFPGANLIIDPAYGLKPKGRMEALIDTGIGFINDYGKVYTTRLHGLILSVLLNKNVVILDNSYGKCTKFYNMWLRKFENIKLIGI